MNNKYGYRLVDILKRGRGRKFSRMTSSPPSPRDRSEKGIKADRGDEGQGRSVLSLHFCAPLARDSPDRELQPERRIDSVTISIAILLTNVVIESHTESFTFKAFAIALRAFCKVRIYHGETMK